uniref:Uncharacterized protein n=1 Tax=Timema shepardi TaxID=629360 RepID=A0A7R9ATX3_TIMSH|nr:unnamed protein product [Timema shepardi]
MVYLSSRIGSSNHYLLHWAVCIPSGCNSHDLKEFLVDNFYGLGQELQVHVNVRDDMCHYDKKVTFDKWDIIFIKTYPQCIRPGSNRDLPIFASLIEHERSALDHAATKTAVFEDLLLAFSVSENLGKLLSHTPSDLGIDCVFGFKFYSMIMILGGHSLLFLIGGPVLNETGVYKVRGTQGPMFRCLFSSATEKIGFTHVHPKEGLSISAMPYDIVDKPLGSTFDRYSNFDLHAIGSLVYSESSALDHAATEVVRSIANEPFKNNQVFVDTFFLVSGFLLSRLLLVELDKKKRVNLFSFFALRYIRILKYLKNILLAGAMVDPMAETPLSRVPSLSKVVEVSPSTLGCSLR